MKNRVVVKTGRKLALAGLVLGVVLFVPATAASAGEAPYPPDGCQLTASSNVVAPGDVILITGVDFQPGESIDLFLLSDPVYLTTVVADAAGSFSVEVTIPEGTTPGFHEIRATSGTCRVSQGFTVTGPGVSAVGGGRLAFTGSDSLPWAWIALVLVAIGTALVIGARRRAQVRHRAN